MGVERLVVLTEPGESLKGSILTTQSNFSIRRLPRLWPGAGHVDDLDKSPAGHDFLGSLASATHNRNLRSLCHLRILLRLLRRIP